MLFGIRTGADGAGFRLLSVQRAGFPPSGHVGTGLGQCCPKAFPKPFDLSLRVEEMERSRQPRGFCGVAPWPPGSLPSSLSAAISREVPVPPGGVGLQVLLPPLGCSLPPFPAPAVPVRACRRRKPGSRVACPSLFFSLMEIIPYKYVRSKGHLSFFGCIKSIN